VPIHGAAGDDAGSSDVPRDKLKETLCVGLEDKEAYDSSQRIAHTDRLYMEVSTWETFTST
jgi:hypothetical protein